MTQAELARALGVSQQAVFAYEIEDRREPPIIAKAMRHAERIQNLTKTAQRFLIRILDTLEESGHVIKPINDDAAR